MTNKLHSIEAERIVIGSAILSPQVAVKVAALPDELFSLRLVRESILPAMRNLLGRDVEPTSAALLQEVSGDDNVRLWIADAVASVDSPEQVDYYCDILRDLAVLRRFKRVIDRIERREEGPPLEAITRAVEEAATLLGSNRGLRLLADAAEGLEKLDAPPTVTTGILGLDDYLQIRPGHLVFVAATPGMGKTSLGVQIADIAASGGLSVLFVSLEMSAEEIARRLASRRGLRAPAAIREYLRALPVYYDTTHTPGGLRERVRALNPDVVIVDYIGLMSPERPTGSRVNDLATISRSLKTLAMARECPVIAMSQLNREAHRGAPQLHHLRDSGALEADADAVVILYDQGDAKWVKLAKNRHGAVGAWDVEFDPERCLLR